MQKCYKCDLQFQDDRVRFCPYCGSPLAVDKEWALEQKRIQEEKRRAEEEKELARQKKAAWDNKCRPHIEKYEEIIASLRRFNFDAYSYKKLVDFLIKRYSFLNNNYYEKFSGLNSDDALDYFIKLNKETEIIVDAMNDKVSSQNIDNLKKILELKYKELKEYIEDLKFYNRNKAFHSFFIDYFNAFARGGMVKYGDETRKYEMNEFEIADQKGLSPDSVRGTEVSYSSIPYNYREKWHIITAEEYAQKYGYVSVEMKYYRYNIYEVVYNSMKYYDFGSRGYEGTINSLYYTSKDCANTIVKYYSDLVTLSEQAKKFSDDIKKLKKSIGELEEKKAIESLKIFTSERKYESSKDDSKVVGYIYNKKIIKFGNRK